MKIAANAIDSFINNQINKLDAALLYGPDNGLTTVRKNIIIKKVMGDNFDNLLLSKYNADELIKEPSKLINEVNALSLMGGRKFIIIYNCQTSLSKIIEDTLKNKKSDSFILLLAAELTPNSSLRKLFEAKTDKIVALPAYQDDFNTTYNIARSELKDLKPTNEILTYIAHNVSGDRMFLMQELAKLKLYYSSGDSIDFATLETLLSHSNNHDYQNLTNAIADKDPCKTSVITEELIDLGIMPVTLVRVIMNYFQRLKIVRTNLDLGLNFNEASKNLKPPIFFKQKTHLERHTQKWSLNALNHLLQKLENLEKTIKLQNIIKADIILKYFVLMVSNSK